MGRGNNVVTEHSHRQRRGKTRDGVAWGAVWARGKTDLTKKKTSRRRIEANLMGSKVNMNLPLVAAAAAPALCTQCLPPAWLTCNRDVYPRNDEGGREDQRNNAVAQGKSSIRALPCFGNLIFCHHTCHLGPSK